MLSRSPSPLLFLFLLLLGSALGCWRLQPRSPAREPVTLDPGVLSALRPRHPAWGLEFEWVETTAYCTHFVFRFQTYSDSEGDFKSVVGDYYATRTTGGRPAPLLLVSPILAGPVDDYLASRLFSWQATKHGMSTFFLQQEKVILAPDRDGLNLEAWVRENARDNIKALDLIAGLPEVDGSRLGSFGVSLGAIKNVVLVAMERRLRANVMVLAGADLPRILETSQEELVARYLRGRFERDGLHPAEVSAELRRWFFSEPANLAKGIATDRVILFLGRLDNKVPYESGMFLRRELGEPLTHVFLLGHYTAVLGAPWTASKALGWLRERL